MTVSNARERFTHFLQFEKRMSVHTLVAYNTDLEQFSTYLLESYEISDLDDVDHTMVRSWIVKMMEEGINPRTINRKITTLRSFYRFLLKNQLVSADPMPRIQAPKTAKRLPVFVEKEGMEQLLDNSADHFSDSYEGMLSHLLIGMFYSTGARLSELINLKTSDVDLHSCQIKVLGKRNKERIIPFTNELKEEIKNYLEGRPAGPEFFFLSKSGKKLYEKFVYRVVNKYLSSVTTIRKKSPHVLRHTFATHMLNNGADLNAIKELLGHASLAATQVYTHNTVEKLKNIHKQAHPKA